MKIKTIEEPKTIKIDCPTWRKLKTLTALERRETLDDTIWMLIVEWEKKNGTIK